MLGELTSDRDSYWIFTKRNIADRDNVFTRRRLASFAWHILSIWPGKVVCNRGTPPYTWAVKALPDGISLNSASGEISGTFTENSENTPIFDRITQTLVSVTVTDSAGGHAGAAALTIALMCGGSGNEDNLIEQYLSNVFPGFTGITDAVTSKQFAPRCMDITRSAHSGEYSFQALSSSNLSDPGVALLLTLLTGQGVAFFPGAPFFTDPDLTHG